jgi:hypothetical protein
MGKKTRKKGSTAKCREIDCKKKEDEGTNANAEAYISQQAFSAK